MKIPLKTCLYSAILTGVFFAYFLKIAKANTLYALGLAVLSFGVFLVVGLAREWKSEKKRKALSIMSMVALFSMLIAPVSLPLAVNTFITFGTGVLVLIYREELLPSMSAFMYGWIGAGIGFVLAIIVVPKTITGDVERALALICFMLASMVSFLFLGRKLHYRPFNRYSSY